MSKTEILLRHREHRFIKIDVHFVDEISGLVTIKLLDHKTCCTNTIKGEVYQEHWISGHDL